MPAADRGRRGRTHRAAPADWRHHLSGGSAVDGNKRWIVGVDLGGTNVVVGLVPIEGGEVQALHTLPTEAQRGPKFVVDRIVEMIETSISKVLAGSGGSRDQIAGVGIGSP